MAKLIVVTGPTGSGKTALAIKLALRLGCHILSADSRQIFRDIPITTAAPTAEELAMVPHHFVGTLPLDSYFSAAQYEEEAIALLNNLFSHNEYAILCGGSMMYVDAVTRGIDEIPTISDEIRQSTVRFFEENGIEAIRQQLQQLDPDYYRQVDLNNPKRLIHAVEICREAGVPYSSLRTGRIKPRNFEIVSVAIDYPRELLFDRINHRVEKMISDGMIDEARRVYPLRHLNSLNTVGFKELFAHFDGEMDLDTAIARIQKNTRVYAKKQLTWIKNRPETIMISPETSTDELLNKYVYATAPERNI